MKKLAILVFLSMLVVSVTFSSTSAEKTNNHDSTGKEQIFDQYLLSEFNNEIFKAIKEFYKDESIMGIQFDCWDKQIDVVEIEQTEKGHELEYNYNGKKEQFDFVIKFTILPYKDKVIGTDTITFGIQEAANMKEENIVKVLNYDHKKPPKN